MSRTPIATGVASLIASLTPLAAAGSDDTVAPVTVTATRTAQTADEALSSVTVIDRQQIRQSQAQSVPDLLANQQGLSFSANGPYGKATSLFMRGTNGDHVLVLVDGIQAGSATSGPALQHLSPEQIERIEIVRGPRSSLYGAEAIGGVVQIFTREGRSGETRVDTSAMGGGNGTSEVTTAVSGGDDDTRASFAATKFDTDGIDATSTGQPDEDGYTKDAASVTVSQDIGDHTTLSVRGQYADGQTEIDNSCPSGDCFTEFTQVTTGAQLDTQVADAWAMKIRAGEHVDESATTAFDGSEDVFDTQRRELSWQNDITIGTQHVVTLGVDASREKVDSTAAFTVEERDNTAGFAQWQWFGHGFDVQLSGRYDDAEGFGEKATGGIAVGYELAAATRVYGSYGTGFHAPTFNDLYFPLTSFTGGSFVGNPDLEPEESETLELGIKGGTRDRWSASVYHTEIDNLIDNVDPDGFLGPAPTRPENLNAASITGVELAGNTTRAGWDLRASLTLLDTELRTDTANDGNELRRRPERTFNLDFSRDIGAVRFGTHVRHESARYDDVANTDELDGFTLIGMRLSWQMRRNLSVEASVENLGDVDYQTARSFATGFETLGRTAYLRLRYQL